MVQFYLKFRLLVIAFVLMAMAAVCHAQDTPALSIGVTGITSTDATVIITPSDAEAKYYYKVVTKARFDSDGGVETAVQNQITIWTQSASWYDDTTWQEMMSYDVVSGTTEISVADRYDPMMPETDYVVYAFGMDTEGNVTIPVTVKDFTTLAGTQSDNKFTITLNSITQGAFGRMNVKATVTPTNTDTYFVKCLTKSAIEGYDLTPGSDSYKQFIQNELLDYLLSSDIVSGEHDYTFEKKVKGTEYSIFVLGVDENRAPSTGLTRLDFTCEEYPIGMTIEVSDITPMNAHIVITPPDEDMYYYLDVAPKYLVEEKGGTEMIPEKFIIDWWKYLAEMYGDGTTWQEFIPFQCRKGKLDTMAADIIAEGAMSGIYWGHDWLLYAVGFNADGEVVSNIATYEFTTPSPEASDLSFEFEVVSITKNESLSAAWGKTKYDATIDIYPSNTEEKYRFNYMKTRVVDPYDDKEEGEYKFLTDQFLENSMLVSDAARVKMPGLDDMYYGDVKEYYYLMAIGWNEGPTTPLYKYKFNYDTSTAIRVNEIRDTEIMVIDGTITVVGECDGAAVYSTSGKLMGTLRSGRTINVPAGMYLVSYKVNGKTYSKKVVVK